MPIANLGLDLNLRINPNKPQILQEIKNFISKFGKDVTAYSNPLSKHHTAEIVSDTSIQKEKELFFAKFVGTIKGGSDLSDEKVEKILSKRILNK